MNNVKRFLVFAAATGVSAALTFSMASCETMGTVEKSVNNTVSQVGSAVEVSVKQDVVNAVININTVLASNPQTNVSDIVLTISSENTVVTASGDINYYTVTGVHSPSGFTYSYDSSTGLYK